MEPGEEGRDFWYQAYRRSGIRPLQAGERRRLGTERIASGIASMLLGLGTPFLFLLALGGLVVLSDWWSYNQWDPFGATVKTIRGLLLIGLSLALLVIIALLALVIKYGAQRSRGLGRDLAAGFVNQYSIQGHTVEILPYSNRIWMVDKEEQPWFRGPAEQERLAAVPRIIQRIQMPVSEAEIKALISDSPKRILSDAERTELRRLARQEWLFPVLGALIFQCWFWSVLIYAVVSGSIWKNWPGLFGLASIGCLGYRFTKAAKATVQAQAVLRRDVRRAVVEDQQIGAYRVEVLSESGRLWTIDGQPAHWRRKISI